MKRVFILSVLLSLCSGLWAQETEGIEINEKNFPDPVFREYISIVNLNGQDGILTQDEIKRMTNINLGKSTTHGAKVRNLKGLEYFIYLESLDCSGHELTELDISALKNLRELTCNNNQLTSLDVSTLTNLRELACNNNQLTSLTGVGNTVLEKIWCWSNKLKSLDVSGLSTLKDLHCEYNQLTSLNVSNCEFLSTLSFQHNQISSLDISDNPMLTILNITNNPLSSTSTSLTLKLPNLSGLSCALCGFGSLDLSGCEKLTSLRCDPLKEMVLPQSLKRLACISHAKPFTALNISGLENLEEVICEDGIMESIQITDCPNLNTLECNNNNLKSLNLDGSGDNSSMLVVRCNNNKFEELNIDKPNLGVLECEDNLLTSLHISTQSISELFCSNNYLSDIDMPVQNRMAFLKCYRNNIKADNMEKIIKALPQQTLSAQGTPMCSFIPYDARSYAVEDGFKPEGNEILYEQVKEAYGKGFEVVAYTDEKPILGVQLISDYYYRTVFVGIDGIRANAAPVIVSSTGNTLTVQGAEDGESVTAYDLDGRQLGRSVCRNGQATLRLSTRTENVILVKIGDDTIKVRMK